MKMLKNEFDDNIFISSFQTKSGDFHNQGHLHNKVSLSFQKIKQSAEKQRELESQHVQTLSRWDNTYKPITLQVSQYV
jgi:hypothetical protein